ncbi:MAG: hypothetical protein HOP33_08135 [Verrucomicrobia bacterium]|nr:hypothetical protein [Verrucomicrobiota bacterium]
MTAPAETSSCCETPSANTDTQAIDASCRWPVLGLFKGASVWLVVSSFFGIIASLKFHKATMFADCAWFSYGRAYAVWENALVYGFCVPSALAVGVWLIARLGRVKLCCPVVLTAGAKLWHIGVFVGLLGILYGDSTGYEWLELPRYSMAVLLGSFLLMSVCALITHARRTERTLHPSHWFTLAALFWFPWILSTAFMLLQLYPVRGVAQAAIAWWYSGNLLVVWLSLAGLGATFYFLPKLAERPLQSSHTAHFIFWTLILFGTWVGIPGGAALPAWMPSLSASASLMLLVPAVAIAFCVWQTASGSQVKCNGGPLCYTKFGGTSLALSLVLLALTGIPQIERITNFTWFNHGHTALRLYSFFAMTLFAAAYHILPRVTGARICPHRIRIHFFLAMPGSLLMTLPLVVGGVLQGVKLLNPETPFLDASKSALMAFRITSLGEVLFAAGAVLFLINVTTVLFKTCWSGCKTTCCDSANLKCAEVKA